MGHNGLAPSLPWEVGCGGGFITTSHRVTFQRNPPGAGQSLHFPPFPPTPQQQHPTSAFPALPAAGRAGSGERRGVGGWSRGKSRVRGVGSGGRGVLAAAAGVGAEEAAAAAGEGLSPQRLSAQAAAEAGGSGVPVQPLVCHLLTVSTCGGQAQVRRKRFSSFPCAKAHRVKAAGGSRPYRWGPRRPGRARQRGSRSSPGSRAGRSSSRSAAPAGARRTPGSRNAPGASAGPRPRCTPP